MAHKERFVATGGGYWVKDGQFGALTQVIDSSGNIKGNIQEALTQGSIYVGDAAGITSELAVGTTGQVLTSNGTTAAWLAGGVPSGTEIEAVNDTATGAVLDFFHDSASPASDDALAIQNFYGNDDGAVKTLYAKTIAVLGDPTGGSEAGALFSFVANGAGALQSEPDMAVSPGEAGFTYENDGADGQTLYLETISATPAPLDIVGKIPMYGQNDATTSIEYANIQTVIDDPANGAEFGFLRLSAVAGGSLQTVIDVYGDLVEIAKPVLYTQTPQALTGAGAVDVTSQTTAWDCNGAVAGTLVDGNQGQRKLIYCSAYTGNGTLTPSNLLGYSTITFSAVGQSALLEFRGASWVVVSATATLA